MSKCRHPESVFVLWHGGHNYAVSGVDQAEVWPWADVVSNMLDRFHNWDGSTPCVDESSEAHVFYADPRDSLGTWFVKLDQSGQVIGYGSDALRVAS